MTHQALARQYRPQSFDDYVGHESVIQSIQDSLSTQKLHHAYLFTGTRGVGKTTLARLFAKAISCETGITPHPCNQCMHCRTITEGRFVDLLEIDAASRTKVEETKELLAQVDYPPAYGRFKIYLIDEVHMLSTHSFNALLKTLEEPPAHVKFILATTDPNKCPITIRSRCLQFHLKHFDQSIIAKRLAHVLEQMHYSYEESAVDTLAQAAHGSLRDALSLLEQTLNHQQKSLTQAQVNTVAGRADNFDLSQLIQYIQTRDQVKLQQTLDQLIQSDVQIASLLDQLLDLVYHIANRQCFPENETFKQTYENIDQLSQAQPKEQTQNQIEMILHSKKTLDLYPNHHMALSILVMRLLCFQINKPTWQNLLNHAQPTDDISPNQEKNKAMLTQSLAQSNSSADFQNFGQPNQSASSTPKQPVPPIQAVSNSNHKDSSTATHTPKEGTNSPTTQNQHNAPTGASQASSWQALVQGLPLLGMRKQLLTQANFLSKDLSEQQWQIQIPQTLKSILTDGLKKELISVLQQHTQHQPEIQFVFGNISATENPSSTPSNPTKTQSTSPKPAFDTNDPKLKKIASDLNADIIEPKES